MHLQAAEKVLLDFFGSLKKCRCVCPASGVKALASRGIRSYLRRACPWSSPIVILIFSNKCSFFDQQKGAANGRALLLK